MNALRQWDGGSPHSLRGELLQAEDASWAEFRARLREWVELLEIPE